MCTGILLRMSHALILHMYLTLLLMQHESQELANWLACHQNRALEQLKSLRTILESTQSTASAAADNMKGQQANIAMLAQKEQQYTQQLQMLEEKLTSAKYSPLVCL